MASRAARGRRPPPRKAARVQSAGWKPEDAKARFSEVVRRARAESPQHITVRGKAAVVVIAAETFDRLLHGARTWSPSCKVSASANGT